MKKILLIISAFLCVASSFAQDMPIGPDGEDVKRKVDPATYENFGDFKLENRWILSRNTDGNEEVDKYFLGERNQVCAVVLDTTIYVARPNNGSLLKFGLASGRYLGELKLTVDGESIGTGVGALFNLTKDSFGHIVFHGYKAAVGLLEDGTDSGLALYYISDLETGACTKAGDLMVTLDEYANEYLKGRVDFSSIVGDVTRQEAHAIVMAGGAANAGLQIYRWKCEQGSDVWNGDFADKDGAGNPDVIMLAPVATDGNATQWQGATVCTMVQDEEFSGSLFYIDGMSNQPALYDTNGNFVEGGTHTATTTTDEETGEQVVTATRNFPADWYVTEVAVNGICEFTIAGTNFVAYANTQHGRPPYGDVKIAKLGDNFEWTADAGAEMAWASVPAIGMGSTSDGGRRIYNITTSPVYTDKNGKQGIYLLLNRNFNGIGLYTIAEEGWLGGYDVNYATSISLSGTSSTLKIGETQQLTATVLPTDATCKTVAWRSSDEIVATVDSCGLVTAKSIGTATITATTTDGTNLSSSCTITVLEPIYVTSVSMPVVSTTLKIYESAQMSVTIAPIDATFKSVTWSSSDASIATVDSCGLVIAKSIGTATITATTTDGTNLSASCIVKVKSNVSAPAYVAPDAETIERKTDGTEYADFGNFELKNRWAITRNLDKNEFESYFPSMQMITSAVLNNVIYVVNPDAHGTGAAASISKYDLATGRYLGEMVLTLDGEYIGTGSCLRNISVDDYGHLVIHGWTSDIGSTPLMLYYISDVATGACVKAGELSIPDNEVGTNSYRVDYSSIVGDVTGEKAHAIIMACNNRYSTSTSVLRWKREQGSSKWKGDFSDANGDGLKDVVMSALQGTYPADIASQGTCNVVINKDTNHSASTFYIDGTSTYPVLYDVNGNMLDGCQNVATEWLPTENAVNGVCEFNIGGTDFVAYANTQHGKTPGNDIRIIKQGSRQSWSEAAGAEMAWANVPATGMGMASDGGRRIYNITATVYTDENGKQGAYLMLHRCYNGIAVYTISEKGWLDPNGEVDLDETIYATSISLDSITPTMKIGETQQLSAIVVPTDATYQAVTWSSSDDNIATVSTEGIVTAKSEGTVIITATTIDGTNLSASCSITIETNDVAPDYAFEIEAIESYSNTTFTLPVKMVNKGEIVGFQCDIVVPEGISITTTNNRFDITLAGRETETHEIMTQKQSDGSIRVLVYSAYNDAFTGTEGALFNINLNVGDVNGSYEIIIKNIYLSNLTTEIPVSNAVASIGVIKYRKGDANGDGRLSIVDLTSTAQYIMGIIPANFVFSSADINDDSRISIQDLVSIVNLIMNETTNISTASIDLNSEKYTTKTASETTASSSIVIDDIEINAGEEKTITVNLNNSTSLIGGQFDITLPEGLSFVTRSNGRVDAQLDTERFWDHSLNTNILDNGDLRVLIYSNYNTPVENTTGPIFTFKVKAADDAVAGNVVMKVHAIEFSDDALQAVFLDDVNVNVNIISSVSGGGDDVITPTEGLSIENFVITTGEEKTITVNLNNSTSLIGGQFDITLPEGLSFVTRSNGRVYAQLDTERFWDHSLNTNILDNGDLRVLIYSNYNTPVENTTGSIFTFKVKAADDAVAGNVVMKIHAIEFSDDALEAIFYDDLNVDVEIVSSTVSVNELNEAKLQIKSFVGLVEISGLEIGSKVGVYTPSGMLVKQSIADTTIMQMSLTKGIYIIRIDNQYYKVMVK